MKIISADYIYYRDSYHQDLAVAFDDNIKDIESIENLKKRYPSAQITEYPKGSILYPGFINTHIHLEFSANRAKLRYGDFMDWLDSVIENRDELLQNVSDKIMEKSAYEMLESGITSFGAISSFGTELEVCKRVPQRVTFFNELIGSNPATADVLYSDFLQRVSASKECSESEMITPAIAIHSPYSVHPVMIKRAVNLAKEEKMPLTAHFLESSYEREWLESGSGKFKEFFKKFFNTDTPVTNIQYFLSHFDDYPTLFVHCTQTTPKEKEYLFEHKHSIAHCPRSNRLLGCGRLKIEDIKSNLSIATDGLSSNWSLNIFDELRASLSMHTDLPLLDLANRLIRGVTTEAAKAINSNAGKIDISAPADFAVIQLPQIPNDQDELALHTILHTKRVKDVWIAGKKVNIL